VPVAGFLNAVEVLEEFPHQSRLAKPSLPDNRDMTRAMLTRASVCRADDGLQLGIASHERGLEPRTAARAASARNDTEGGPGMHRLLAALNLMGTTVLVGDGGFA
jgi:hypothetical protein